MPRSQKLNLICMCLWLCSLAVVEYAPGLLVESTGMTARPSPAFYPLYLVAVGSSPAFGFAFRRPMDGRLRRAANWCLAISFPVQTSFIIPFTLFTERVLSWTIAADALWLMYVGLGSCAVWVVSLVVLRIPTGDAAAVSNCPGQAGG